MRILVVGGGPAGLMAALGAAEAGARVTLLEKNDDLGRKLLLTGNGRCNLTNDCGLDALVANLPGNGPFLYHALSRFGPEELRAFLHGLGLPTVVEPDGRVFPAAGRSAAVLAALRRGLERAGVTVRTGMAAVSLTLRDGRVTGAATSTGTVEGQAVILATGGASYPQTGSTGDGYRLAAAVGHRIVPPRPALVPLIAAEDWVASLAGLSLPGAGARLADGGRSIGADRGDMLFTHWGVSGPLVLGLSRAAVGCLSA
ncbi:MAG: aminoacetone oxidase family FAD-binding enzyme, partial [Bacteroidota bacterium]